MSNVIDKILEEKLIVIVRGIDKKKIIPLAEAMYDGGVRLIECTYDATGKVSDEENAAVIASLVRHFEGRMVIGAGTVITEKQVQLTKEAGGEFIISPDANPDIIRYTKELGLVSIPGAYTPTEILSANRAGADFVKLFPATNLGPAYIKAVRAPISHVKLLAVGGIDVDNMPEYLKAGVCGFGVGSCITDKKMIEAEDYESITALAEKYVSVIKGA